MCHVFFTLKHFRGRVTDCPTKSLEELVAFIFSRETEIAELDLFRVSKNTPHPKRRSVHFRACPEGCSPVSGPGVHNCLCGRTRRHRLAGQISSSSFRQSSDHFLLGSCRVHLLLSQIISTSRFPRNQSSRQGESSHLGSTPEPARPNSPSQ